MEISIQNLVVAYVDLLGQREQMKGLLFIPPRSDEQGRREFVERIRRSITAARFIQDNFLLHASSSNERHHTRIEGIPPDLARKAQRFRKARITTQRFSDGLVLCCHLSDDGHFPLNSILSILQSSSSMMLCGLAAGFPFRAGIAIGSGCIVEDGSIYGPVLAQAYRIESEVAKYPRVVLSDEMIAWLSSLDRIAYPSDEEMRVSLALRDQCLDLVTRDRDGVFSLDYLGPSAIESLGGLEAVSEPIGEMKDFVDKMIDVHRGNPRILEKYTWVKDYIASRAQG